MKTKLYILIILWILIQFSTCMPHPIIKAEHIKRTVLDSIELSSRVGFIHHDCLAIKNNSLNLGDTMTLILLNEVQQILKTPIISNKVSDFECAILSSERKNQNLCNDFSFYKIELDTSYEIEFAIAIISDSLKASNHLNLVSIDVNFDGNFEFFDACTTNEGVIFSVWSGIPWYSVEIWSSYYYLGYDLTPSCPNHK